MIQGPPQLACNVEKDAGGHHTSEQRVQGRDSILSAVPRGAVSGPYLFFFIYVTIRLYNGRD